MLEETMFSFIGSRKLADFCCLFLFLICAEAKIVWTHSDPSRKVISTKWKASGTAGEERLFRESHGMNLICHKYRTIQIILFLVFFWKGYSGHIIIVIPADWKSLSSIAFAPLTFLNLVSRKWYTCRQELLLHLYCTLIELYVSIVP